jgi:hypothetical protein
MPPTSLAWLANRAAVQHHEGLISKSALSRHSPPFAVLFAVGTPVSGRPPHRSERAEFPHSAPTSGV